MSMKRNYYIFSSGKLIRKDNTLYFEPGESKEPEQLENEEEIIEVDDEQVKEIEETYEARKLPRKPIPVEDIESIYCFSELRFNTKFLNYLSQNNITLHLFNYYGYYSGSFYPREPFISGKLLVNQVEHYTNGKLRVKLAQKFVEGSAKNIRKNLMYYDSRNKDMSPFIPKVDELITKIGGTTDVQELMGIEGNIRANYYASWNLIVDESIDFKKRVKNPPDNPINALISFGNSLVYTTVLSEIYKTQLNPLISFLHEPGERRFSLSLDIAEIFKPLLTDRIIFTLLNKGIIKKSHFDEKMNFAYLTEAGRKLFLQEYDEKLKTTIKHRELKRSVSYRHLIRLECYKIVKHILGEKEYKPFQIWW